jgi:hypothetical protein
VFSGGGLHLYWLLKEPLDAQVYRERLEALNRKLASVLAGDLQATDVCRLMRLPGTVNSKHGDVRVVKVERLEADRRYDFDELEEAIAGWRPLLSAKEVPVRVGIRASKKPAQTQPGNPFLAVAEEQGWKPPLDVEQALASMTYPGNVHDVQIRVAWTSPSGTGRPRRRRSAAITTARLPSSTSAPSAPSAMRVLRMLRFHMKRRKVRSRWPEKVLR